MRLSEKQALIMWDVLRQAIHVSAGFGGYSQAELVKIAESIINQQSNIPTDREESEAKR